MKKRAQLDGLTITRGIAAWFVVLFHVRSGMPWLPDGVMQVLGKGYLAVDFFFLLSGFVIYLSAHEAFLEQGWRATPSFFQRRIARIYPLYILMLALTVAFALLLTATGRNTSDYPWNELALHILLLQNWGFTSDLSWNHPAWSISTEFAAYSLFPLIILITPISRMPRWILAAGIPILLAIMGAWLRAGGLTDLGQNIPRFGLVRCLFEFTAGCMLCALWLRGGSANRGSLVTAASTFTGAALLWSLDPSFELWAFPLMAASLIYLLAGVSQDVAKDGRTPLLRRALIYLGEISYATYLAHFMLFIWFKIVLVQDAASISPAQIAFFLLLTLAASIMLYHGVEKPGRRFGQSRASLSISAVS